jgi:hypothetical protein
MKHSVLLTIASLLSILFGTFHLADDIARGMSLGALPISLRWSSALSGSMERSCSPNGDSGYVIIFLASLLLMGVPVIHMRAQVLA